MVAILSLLVIVTLSILITRVAAVALSLTGLSRQAAKFQARSAFTGVGFTTTESEKVVNHPVRRRILMILMVVGNVGIVTSMSSLIVTFVDFRGSDAWYWDVLLLLAGLALLWAAATSQWVDKRLSRIINRALARYSTLDVRDYSSLLHLGGDYRITELNVTQDDWLADKTLAHLGLNQEGILLLAINRKDGSFVGAPQGDSVIKPHDNLLLYGRTKAIERLDKRRNDYQGEHEHQRAVYEHEVEVEREREQDPDTPDSANEEAE